MTQTLLTIFIPTFAVLIGILINRNDVSRLDVRMNSLEGRFHADMLMLIGKVSELEVRMAKLETQRQ
jgi:hypothetical protein